MVKNSPARAGDPGDEDSIPGLESSSGEVAAHSSVLAWEIPWTEEPGGLQSMGSQRVGLKRLKRLSTQCMEHHASKG